MKLHIIIEPDSIGLGRMIHEGKHYGIPIPVLEYIAELEKDAARYRKLKKSISVPYAMQSFINHMGWHPDTFKMGIDEAIDAMNETIN